jgi:hypothetical protein
MDGLNEGEGVRDSAANPAGFDGRPNPSQARQLFNDFFLNYAIIMLALLVANFREII